MLKSNSVLLLALLYAGLAWGQKPTIAEENLAKTRTALIGKWEVLRAGSQAEAKSIGITGDYIEFTGIEAYPKPVHPSLTSHYKVSGYWHGFSSFATGKDRFAMLKGDASYDPTTATWSFGFQLELPGSKPGEIQLVSKSGLIRGAEMLLSSYSIDKTGAPYSALDAGVRISTEVSKD